MGRAMATLAQAEPTTTREAILDAAERRFADYGFVGTSVREIAGDVRLKNQASIYHYFRNKKQLYEAVLRRRIDGLLPLWQADGALTEGLDRLIDHLVEHPHLARLIERAGLDEDAYVRSAVPRLLRPLYAAGVERLRDAAGPWNAADLPHLAAGLYHLIFGYFANASLLQSVLGEDPRSAKMLARQRRFLAAAIARLLSTELTEGTEGAKSGSMRGQRLLVRGNGPGQRVAGVRR